MSEQNNILYFPLQRINLTTKWYFDSDYHLINRLDVYVFIIKQLYFKKATVIFEQQVGFGMCGSHYTLLMKNILKAEALKNTKPDSN